MKGLVAMVATLAAGCISAPNVQTVDAVDAGPPAQEEASATADPAADAAPAPPSLCNDKCTTAGGTCDGGTCVIECPGAASCATTVKCPADMPCTVKCTGHEACQNVECIDANSCAITCDGDHACHGKVTCKGILCAVTCANGGCALDGVQCCAATCTVNGAKGKCG